MIQDMSGERFPRARSTNSQSSRGAGNVSYVALLHASIAYVLRGSIVRGNGAVNYSAERAAIYSSLLKGED